MVSIRRRKHLAVGPGNRTHVAQFSRFNAKRNLSVGPPEHMKPFKANSTPLTTFNTKTRMNSMEAYPVSSNASGCSSSKEKHDQPSPVAGQECKQRKRQRSKYFEEHQPCGMRGVYFKNMKWQAAIKVDKKQIHLGTVGSQEEAAHLYDRAAFMCGREPNFELSEEEKNGSFDWEIFLAMTRSGITTKKHQKRVEAWRRQKNDSQMNSVDNDASQTLLDLTAIDDMDVYT